MAALVVADHDGARLQPATLNAVGAAAAFGAGVDLLVAGDGCRGVAEEAAAVAGIDRVRLADDPAWGHLRAEAVAPLVASLAPDYGQILFPANTTGKNLAPRAAALLDVAQISDVVEIAAPDVFVRPIYAGNAMATVRSRDPVKVVTVRATAFPAAAASGGAAPVEPVDAAPPAPGGSRFLRQELSRSERPELTGARVVVSGGRGMQSSDNFALVEAVADRLGAAVGASRAAVDAGYRPNDFQVGQTGKVVAPELYVAVGISGAIQHLAGMKDSKVIVAINKDEEAPMVQIADYGLVADLFKALPALADELDRQGVKPR